MHIDNSTELIYKMKIFIKLELGVRVQTKKVTLMKTNISKMDVRNFQGKQSITENKNEFKNFKDRVYINSAKIREDLETENKKTNGGGRKKKE